MGELTAAHRTLPFGTILLVTNLENSRQVRVRINDRGPYVRGRILDLSHAAAQELAMVRRGTARIVITTTHTRNGTPTKVATGQSILPMVPLTERFHHARADSEGESGRIRYARHNESRIGSRKDVWHNRRARRYDILVEATGL